MFINSFILYSSGGIHFFAIIENKNMKFTKTKRRRLIFNKLMNFTGWQAYESCLSIKWQRLIIITHNIVHVHSAELVIVINDSDKKVYTNLFSVFFVESAVVGLFLYSFSCLSCSAISLVVFVAQTLADIFISKLFQLF